MKFIARLMLAAFLAAFAASSVANAAVSGEAAASMVLSDESMEMSGCATPCGDTDAGESATICDLECGAGGFAAVLASQTQGIFQTPREVLAPPVSRTFGSLSGAPAKQPPRTLV